jgi:oligoribonuclease
VDVSSIKVLALHWYPELEVFKKSEAHLALNDILESVAELRYYREKVFRKPSATAST